MPRIGDFSLQNLRPKFKVKERKKENISAGTLRKLLRVESVFSVNLYYTIVLSANF